jgi:hypothetical protein
VPAWLLSGTLAVASLFVAVAVAGAGAGAGARAAGARSLHAVATASSDACPGGASQCDTFTPPGCSHSCPTVVAGPTLGVSSPQATQYVYLSLTNFPAGDSARIAYCPTSVKGHPVALVSDPNCGLGTYSQSFAVSTVNVVIAADGTAQASFPVPYVPSGSTPIGSAPVVPGPRDSKFFCDNGPDYCALEVTDDGPGVGNGAQDPPDTSANTVIIPLTYFDGSNGCPGSDAILNSDSAYSMAGLIPAAVESTCKRPGGVVALNTVDDSETSISNFAAGGADLTFTDDPGDPADARALKGKSVLYVPVALSASVVSFLGAVETESQGVPFSLNSYKLTPDMVAGIIDSVYGEAFGSDLVPVGSCSQIVLPNGVNCSNPNSLDAFDFLDAQPSGILPPTQFGSFMSGVAIGASAQVTDWLCRQPNAPFTVTVLTHGKKTKKKKQPPPTATEVSVKDKAASTTLTTDPTPGQSPIWPPTGHPDAPWVYPACASYPRLPDLSSSVAQFGMPTSPDLQAKAIRGFAYGGGSVPPSGGSNPPLAFGAMDWSQAAFNGLNVAALQNASGAFVSPSAASITAALKDAVPCPAAGTAGCPAGTYSLNYADTTNAAAYPMPLITYAVVPTTPSSHDTAMAIKSFLTDLVSYSHSGGSIPMPSGYVALPDSLYGQATSTIAKITVPPPAPGEGNGSSSTTGSGSGSGTGPFGGAAGGQGTVLGAALAHERLGDVAGAGGRHHRSLGPTSFADHVRAVVLALVAGAGRWKYVLIFTVAAVALLAGPLLVAAPRLRRRLPLPKRKPAS